MATGNTANEIWRPLKVVIVGASRMQKWLFCLACVTEHFRVTWPGTTKVDWGLQDWESGLDKLLRKVKTSIMNINQCDMHKKPHSPTGPLELLAGLIFANLLSRTVQRSSITQIKQDS